MLRLLADLMLVSTHVAHFLYFMYLSDSSRSEFYNNPSPFTDTIEMNA